MFEVLKYIHDNIEKNLELTDVANLFGYSMWHFCSKFHAYTGKSFVKYVRWYRIQLAALDILSGRKITEIALNCGYESVGGFNKAFLAEFGCLPREYKKHAKEARLYYERRKRTMYQFTDRCELLRQMFKELALCCNIPIATGERLFSKWDFKRLLTAGGVDIIQPDLSHAGGITEVKKIAAMAESYDVALAPHCPLGPIALAACLNVDANKEIVIEENKTPHNWKNPVWHHEDGSVAEW